MVLLDGGDVADGEALALDDPQAQPTVQQQEVRFVPTGAVTREDGVAVVRDAGLVLEGLPKAAPKVLVGDIGTEGLLRVEIHGGESFSTADERGLTPHLSLGEQRFFHTCRAYTSQKRIATISETVVRFDSS
jgi:hypothetical protein